MNAKERHVFLHRRPRFSLAFPGLRRPSVALFGFLWLSLAVAPAWAKGRKPPEIHFAVIPSTVTAGRTLTVRCFSSEPLKNAAIFFGERKALFYHVAPLESRALLGIHSQEAPGPKEAVFYAELKKGRVFQSTVSFRVEGGTYPVSRVKLSSERDGLITSGQVEKDAKTLDAVYREPRSPEKLWSGFFILPATGVVSSPYGARRAYGDRAAQSAHTGTDIANKVDTLIVAPNRGRVAFSGWLDSFGHSVVLDHGQGVFSYYLHMRKALVKENALAEQGAPLGLMGAEGVATGPHLHWSFVVSGERVEPLEWTEKEFR